VKSAALAIAVALAVACAGAARAQTARVWEVNGVRLEASQVERLATDIARQTVVAVQRQPGLTLRAEQASALERIYHAVALDTYDQVVAVVNRTDLDDAAKESEVKRLVIAGQEQSTLQVQQQLDPAQYATYRAWEQKQVAAFQQRGLWSGGRRGRREER